MWYKERWESRWRVVILNPIAWIIAIAFPFLFGFVQGAASHGVPAAVAPYLHYPQFAFGWFGEDLPELLLVYIIILAVSTITREWQSGTIEFLAQMPLTPAQIAWKKGAWGSLEIAFTAIVSTGFLWVASIIHGNSLPVMTLLLSTLTIAAGFIALLWLLSACAWTLHSTYLVIVIGLVFYIVSAVLRMIPAATAYSPLTYVCNVSPYVRQAVLWWHLGILIVVAAALVFLTLSIAGHQELIANHGRDQI